MENIATSAYLRLARTMDSSKVDAIGREAKQDAKLGYKTTPFCITFATLEDKNAFKDSARSIELNCNDSFPKQYNKQKERAQDIYKKSIFNNRGILTKTALRLGRPEDPCTSPTRPRRPTPRTGGRQRPG